MRIGIDFDNTIICYDNVFFEVGIEHGFIDPSCGRTKVDVKNFINSKGRETDWTALQGIVYGSEINRAQPYSGVMDFIHHATKQHQIYIVSHKTLFPLAGLKTDLHLAAHRWLEATGVMNLIPAQSIYFELTIEKKISQINNLSCDIFIDDLPEVLGHLQMSSIVQKILFNGGAAQNASPLYRVVRNWSEISKILGVG